MHGEIGTCKLETKLEEDDLTKIFALKKSTTFCLVSWFILPLILSLLESIVESSRVHTGTRAHGRFWQDLIKHGEISCKYGEMSLTVSMVKF